LRSQLIQGTFKFDFANDSVFVRRDIKKAYRRLALMFHPGLLKIILMTNNVLRYLDKSAANEEAEYKYKDICEAYEVLVLSEDERFNFFFL